MSKYIMTYKILGRIKEKVKMSYITKKCRDLKDRAFKSNNKGGKVYLVGLTHLYDPFSEYLDQNTLENWEIETILLEDASKYKGKPEWEEVHNKIAKGDEKTMEIVKECIQGVELKDLSEFGEKSIELIYNSGKEIKLEEGIEKDIYIGIFPRKYRSAVELDRRTKKDVKQIKKYIKKGNVAIIRGYAHLPFLENTLKKRKVKYESYIIGGVPAFKEGTPSMSIPLDGPNLYISGVREHKIEEYLEELLLIPINDSNKDNYKQLKDKENRINLVYHELVNLYPKFKKHPTAPFCISSYVNRKIPYESEKDFINKVKEYLSSREFKNFISKDNLVLIGDLRKCYFNECLVGGQK